MYFQLARICHNASSSIATKGTCAAIRIVIAHKEIRTVLSGLQEDHAIGPDTKMPVTRPGNPFRGHLWFKIAPAVIDHDKIIARTLVF